MAAKLDVTVIGAFSFSRQGNGKMWGLPPASPPPDAGEGSCRWPGLAGNPQPPTKNVGRKVFPGSFFWTETIPQSRDVSDGSQEGLCALSPWPQVTNVPVH